MTAYYNEFDAKKAAWLRELIDMGMIAPGEVDERSIKDVRPDELMGYTQVHAFAGIGVWSYALRLAGWPDDRPVWTGSCPCQPFSSAGKGKAFDDERHLWPAWARLIGECRPPVILGEEVASKAGRAWFDLVSDDLEGMDYAVGALSIPACGISAPHIRQRLWFLAVSGCAGLEGRGAPGPAQGGDAGRPGPTGGVADAERDGRRADEPGRRPKGRATDGRAGFWHPCDWLPCRDGKWRPTGPGIQPLVQRLADTIEPDCGGEVQPADPGEQEAVRSADRAGRCGDPSGKLADTDSQRRQQDPGGSSGNEAEDGRERWHGGQQDGNHVAAGDGEDGCPQGPAQPSPAPLADGPARGVGRGRDILNTPEARVLRLRGYGDAIVAPLAAEFIRAAMEVIP